MVAEQSIDVELPTAGIHPEIPRDGQILSMRAYLGRRMGGSLPRSYGVHWWKSSPACCAQYDLSLTIVTEPPYSLISKDGARADQDFSARTSWID
jgi:hypothetical protein